MSIKYKKTLSRVDLSLNNEVLALLGKEKTGKSTLLRIMAGLLKPTEGNILIDYKDAESVPISQRRIIYIPEGYGLLRDLTVEENLFLTLKFLSKREEKVKEEFLRAVEIFNLKDLLSARVRELNLDDKLRLALARAFISRPSALLLDEPFKGFPTYLKKDYLPRLRLLFSWLNVPVVIATKNYEEAIYLSDRIAVIHNGEIIWEGKADLIKKKPGNIEVAKIVGLRNIFTCVTEKIRDGFLIVNCRGVRIRVDPPEIKDIKEGQRVTIGLPPEEIEVKEVVKDVKGKNFFDGKVIEVSCAENFFEVIVKSKIGNIVSFENPQKVYSGEIRRGREVYIVFSYKTPCLIQSSLECLIKSKHSKN